MTEPTSAVPTPREVVDRFLRCALDPAGSNLADLYAEHFVLEMPFAQPIFPRITETGREELRARFQAGAGNREYYKVDGVVIHGTDDPEVMVVEYDLHGKVVASGFEFVLSYIVVLTIRNGVIVHSRDYSNPIAGAQAMGMLPKLFEMVTQKSA